MTDITLKDFINNLNSNHHWVMYRLFDSVSGSKDLLYTLIDNTVNDLDLAKAHDAVATFFSQETISDQKDIDIFLRVKPYFTKTQITKIKIKNDNNPFAEHLFIEKKQSPGELLDEIQYLVKNNFQDYYIPRSDVIEQIISKIEKNQDLIEIAKKKKLKYYERLTTNTIVNYSFLDPKDYIRLFNALKIPKEKTAVYIERQKFFTSKNHIYNIFKPGGTELLKLLVEHGLFEQNPSSLITTNNFYLIANKLLHKNFKPEDFGGFVENLFFVLNIAPGEFKLNILNNLNPKYNISHINQKNISKTELAFDIFHFMCGHLNNPKSPTLEGLPKGQFAEMLRTGLDEYILNQDMSKINQEKTTSKLKI